MGPPPQSPPEPRPIAHPAGQAPLAPRPSLGAQARGGRPSPHAAAQLRRGPPGRWYGGGCGAAARALPRHPRPPCPALPARPGRTHPLARRMRAAGLEGDGGGEKKTPNPRLRAWPENEEGVVSSYGRGLATGRGLEEASGPAGPSAPCRRLPTVRSPRTPNSAFS